MLKISTPFQSVSFLCQSHYYLLAPLLNFSLLFFRHRQFRQRTISDINTSNTGESRKPPLVWLSRWHRDIRHSDTQLNDAQRNCKRCSEKGLNLAILLSVVMLSVVMFSPKLQSVVMLSINTATAATLSVVMLEFLYAECLNNQYHYTVSIYWVP
jgi:hypothetical protein